MGLSILNKDKIVNAIRSTITSPASLLQLFAYVLPICFLIYFICINFTSLLSDKTFTLNVGQENDSKASSLYLEPSPYLSDRITGPDENTYRELDGIAYAKLKTGFDLKGSKITVKIDGENTSVIPTYTELAINSSQWDYRWDFSKIVPKELKGNAYYFDSCGYFDGKSRLELPDSSSQFENGPFTLYASWKSANDIKSSQEIVGHYNWELLQTGNKIKFQVGRMNDGNGPFHTIEKVVTDQSEEKNVVAVYSPSTTKGGYIDLYVNSEFSGRTDIATSTLYTEYGKSNLTFGQSQHNGSSFFSGSICDVRISNKIIGNNADKQVSFIVPVNTKELSIPVLGVDHARLRKIYVEIVK